MVNLLLAGCSGGGGGNTSPATSSYTIGGSTSGLTGSVVLKDSISGNTLTVSSNGIYTFTVSAVSGISYNVTVFTQPTGQTCSITNGSGTVSGNITNVAVSCSNNLYSVGGTVSGLSGIVVLQNNGGDNATVSADGNFTFTTQITNGNTYSVTVLTQPVGQTCSVSTGAGTVSANNVSNVVVVCSVNTYNVGGSLSGLTGSMVLQDNLGDNLTVSTNGVFTFATKVANGSPYSVTVFTQPTGKNCSVASGTGTIALANVSNVTITCSPSTHIIGGTVTGLNGSMVLQNNGGDNLTISTNGAFSFVTTVTYGNPYSVTLLSQQFPNQSCTIGSGSGTTAANVTNVVVNCVKYTAPRYAFTANMTDNSVSTFVLDNATGRLKFIGKVAAGTAPYSVTVDPSGRYAYVANSTSNDVSQFTIGTNGALTAMTPPTVAAGTTPYSVTIDPTGSYAYVANSGSASVSQYTIGAGGVLTAMATPTVAAGTNSNSVTIDPSGKYAYVANAGSNSVFEYTIGTGGALTAMPIPGVAAGTFPRSVTVDPSGKYAYVANQTSNNISQYTIGTNGVLAAMASPTVAAGTTPVSVTIDPTAKYVYVANFTSSNVSQYSIGTNGALTAMATATVAAGTGSNSVTIDPSGKYAYVTNQTSNDVSEYTIGAGGALTALAPSTISDAIGPVSISVAAGVAPVKAVPQYAFVANAGNGLSASTVSQYTIGVGGALTAMATPTVAAGTTPASVAVDPSGKYAYVANSVTADVSQYSIGAGGALAALVPPTVTAGTSPVSVTIDPSGKYVYVANSGSANVSQYTIGVGGALTAMVTPTVAAGTSPRSITVDPSGKFAYVANWGTGTSASTISQYSIGTGGVLTALTPGTAVAGVSTSYVTVDPSGKFAYAANLGNGTGTGTVSQYTIGANGALTAMVSPTVAAITNPNALTVDPSGNYVYVVNAGGSSITQYTIGASGALTAMTSPTVSTGLSPVSVTVDPSGQYAYVANSGNNVSASTVSQYSIGVGGALTGLATATVAAGTGPTSVITTGSWQ